MFQKDLAKYREMNIQTNVVLANQDNRYDYIEENIDGNRVRMVTTAHRGVGRNRNIALLYASADILMFSDDDMQYRQHYEQYVIKAFESLPKADIIIFNIDPISAVTSRRINTKVKRVHLFNVLNYGFPRVAIRRAAVERANLWVSTWFGGGAKYCSGEDNLFLVRALKSGLKIYTYPLYIGSVKQRESSWFTGFNEKYFFDNGAWLESAFPILKHLLIWYFVFKFSSETSLSIKDMWKLQYNGIKAFKKGLSYDEWRKL
jgi:glycosyltransferase involved in cell wall biosynthesis